MTTNFVREGDHVRLVLGTNSITGRVVRLLTSTCVMRIDGTGKDTPANAFNLREWWVEDLKEAS